MNSVSVYRPLFRRAWTLAWRAKYLWFFGLFTAVIAGGGEVNSIVRNGEKLVSIGTWAEMLRAGEDWVSLWQFRSLVGLPLGAYSIGLLLLGVGVFFLWFACVAQGALTVGILRERRERMSITVGVEEGKKFAARIAVINIAYYLISGLAWIVCSLPPLILYVLWGGTGWFVLLLVVAFILLIPAALILTMWYRLAIVSCVVGGTHVRETVHTALKLLKQNWLVVIEYAVLNTVTVSVLALIGASVVVLAGILVFGPLVVFGYVFSAPVIFTMSMACGGVLILAGIAALGAWLATFQQALWVFCYQRLSENRPYAKIARLAVAFSLWMRRKR